MPVKYIKSMDEFNSILEVSNSQLVVIDFTASWCGPCQYMAPVFEKMSEEMIHVVIFAKVDVDEVTDVAERCNIQAMPTFQLYRGGKMVAEMIGADVKELNDLVNKHK